MGLVVTLNEVVPQVGHHSNSHQNIESKMVCSVSICWLLIEVDPNSLVSSFTRMMLRSHHLRESSDRVLSSRIVPSSLTIRLAFLSLLGGMYTDWTYARFEQACRKQKELTERLLNSVRHKVSEIRPDGAYDHGKTSINLPR